LLGQRWQRKSQVLLHLLAFLGILVVINVLTAKVSWRYDATASSLYSLSEQTKKVLADLNTPVTITAFIRDDMEGEQVRDLLRQYSRASRKISVTFVDPMRFTSTARRHNVERLNTILVEAGGRKKLIEPTDLFVAAAREIEFRGEQAITQAIIQLSSDVTPRIYFTQGHGELILTSGDLWRVVSHLKGEGYSLGVLEIGALGTIPEDAALIVAAGPRRDLLPGERELLVSYVRRGGKLLLLLGPVPGEELKEWKALLGSLGLVAHDDVVVDPERAFFLDPMAVMPQMHLHSITKDLLKRRLPVVMSVTRSFGEVGPGGDFTVTSLLVTSEASWGETSFTGSPRRDEADLAGPLTVAVAITRPVPGAPKRSLEDLKTEVPGSAPLTEQQRVAVVVGNFQFIRGDALDFPGNMDFFMNAVSWLLERDNLISIRPKFKEVRPASLTPPQAVRVFYGTVAVMPSLVAAAGVAVWWRRRWL